MKKIAVIISFISLFLLVSCNNDNSKVSVKFEEKTKQVELKIKETKNEYSKYLKKSDTQVNNTSWELKIWENIIIKKWFPSNLTSEFYANNNEQTYVNSNVENYFFYTTWLDKDTKINDYKSTLLKNGWKEIKEIVNNDEEVNIDEEEAIETTRNITYRKDNKEIKIFLSDNIPDNLEKLWLEWTYVEVHLLIDDVEENQE